MPLLAYDWNIRVSWRYQAKRKDYYAEICPNTEHHHIDDRRELFVLIDCFDVGSSCSEEHIARVVHSQNHDPNRNLIAHYRENHESWSHEMMEQKLVKFMLSFAFDHQNLENWKGMHSKLNHEIDLHLSSFSWRPVRVIFVDLHALPSPANIRRKPGLLPKQRIKKEGSDRIVHGVEGQLQNWVDFVHSLISFVGWLHNRINFFPHEMIVGVSNYLNKRLIT